MLLRRESQLAAGVLPQSRQRAFLLNSNQTLIW